MRRGVRFDTDRESANARAGKNCDCARICRIFQHDGIARPQKRFAEQVDGLLAAVGDKQLLAR